MEDIKLTNQLRKVGEVLCIRVIDHVIVTETASSRWRPGGCWTPESSGNTRRFASLADELEPGLCGPIRVLGIATGEKKKRALYEKLRASKAEGIVFKQRSSPCKAGRPSSDGAHRKHKFSKSAAVVLLLNAGNAYLMGGCDGAKLVEIGKVFAGTTNASRKEIDALLTAGKKPIAEVKYATDDEQLFPPVFVRLRTDKAAKAAFADSC